MIKRASLVVNNTLEFVHKNVTSFPVDLKTIAYFNRIKLLPLSKQIADGQDQNIIFEFWQNTDGAAHVYCKRGHDIRIIGYNDRKPPRRVRFTLAEEIMHIILGHSYDIHFDVNGGRFDPEIYAAYEEEAHLAAGLLLCNPKTCYRLDFERQLTESDLMRIFLVSRDCAYRTICDLHEYEQVIKNSPHYKKLNAPVVSLYRRTSKIDITPSPNEGALL
jgi:Zn-dependent peptidase ImmA (M78 family)